MASGNLKPGWKTTEFWLTLIATMSGVLLASGLFPEGGVAQEVLAVIVAGLANLGYAISRGLAKSNPNALRG
jgi:hypothetical protein